MTNRTIFRSKNTEEKIRSDTRRIASLEIRARLANNLSTAENTSFMFQSTQYVKAKSWGDGRLNPLTAPTVIHEDSTANIICNAEVNDIGGSGPAIASPFNSSYRAIPMNDKDGKTAWYHGHASHIKWDDKTPVVNHVKAFMASKSLVLNIPATTSLDQDTFIYYAAHSDFNLTTSKSFAIWFYPTSLTAGGQLFKMIHYRYIDASNYWMITFKEGDPKIYAFVNEASVLTKTVTANNLLLNQWNLIIWSYNITTNELLLELNNAGSSTASHAEVLTPPYTTLTNMFVGGIPTDEEYRITGYLGQFFGRSGVFTGTERDNIWNHGTAVIT